MEKFNQEKNIDNKNNDQDIDLRKYINIFIRRKNLFVITSFLITSFGVVYSIFKQPVYRGYFQIIVEKQTLEVSALIERSQMLKKLNNYVGDVNSDNKTQEAILKSPLVLKPVYEYFQNEHNKIKGFREVSYNKWLNRYLKIEFEDGTNILSIKFDDEDKDIIISTLNLISKSYQNYSMEDREKNIKNGIEYLEYQRAEYKEKSLKSLKALNEFSIKNGLVGDLDGIVEFESTMQKKDKKFNNNLDKTDSKLGLRYSSQFKLLEDNEAKLLELSARLKPNSKTLETLKIKINNLQESLKRPNQILLEFRELNRLARRDEEFLTNIEESLGILKLEQVKQLNPWQLITEPTIEDQIIAPKRIQITMITFLFSLIIAGALSIYKENKEEIIYELEDFSKIIPFNLKDIFIKEFPNLNELIFKNIFININSKNKIIGLIVLNDDLFKNKNSELPEYLITKYKFRIIDMNSLVEIENLEKIIILAEPGKIKFTQLRLIISYLKTFDSKKFLWIFVNDKIN